MEMVMAVARVMVTTGGETDSKRSAKRIESCCVVTKT